MSVNGYLISQHIVNDRLDRIVEILATVGFGKEIKRISDVHHTNTFKVLTSTGVIMVVNETKKLCVTAYKATPHQISNFI